MEYGYRNEHGRWMTGFETRESAIAWAIAAGMRQVRTARFERRSPAWYARSEARLVLQHAVAGMQESENAGRVTDARGAIEYFQRIERSVPDFLEEPSEDYYRQIDLMAKLEKAVQEWLLAQHADFAWPLFVVDGTEELHVAGPNLNIPIK